MRRHELIKKNAKVKPKFYLGELVSFEFSGGRKEGKILEVYQEYSDFPPRYKVSGMPSGFGKWKEEDELRKA